MLMQSVQELENFIDVPCTKCIECLGRKRNEWTFRLSQEKKVSEISHFLTLTYDDENLPLAGSLPSLHKPDLQNFFKRLRKKNAKKWNKKIKYYAIGEYGTELGRPHYHAITFNMHPDLIKDLNNTWSKGLTHTGRAQPASIRYLTKYVINKVNKRPDKESDFNLISQGIGKNYAKITKQYHRENLEPTVLMDNGTKAPMPRYIKDKIFGTYDKQQKTALSHKQQEKSDKLEKEHIKKYGVTYWKLQQQHREHLIKRLETHLNKNNKL